MTIPPSANPKNDFADETAEEAADFADETAEEAADFAELTAEDTRLPIDELLPPLLLLDEVSLAPDVGP